MSPYRKYKPMPHEKVVRNEQLYQLRVSNPKRTYRHLGEMFGISRQRAHKIIKRLHSSQVIDSDVIENCKFLDINRPKGVNK